MILVDSNVLVDVMSGDSSWGSWSRSALVAAANTNELAINPIIYAELSARFSTIEELERQPMIASLRRLPLPYEAAFLAGKAFVEYRRRGGARTAPTPDFYIGAHAAVSGLSLLTRDRRRYAGYFPSLTLIAPT